MIPPGPSRPMTTTPRSSPPTIPDRQRDTLPPSNLLDRFVANLGASTVGTSRSEIDRQARSGCRSLAPEWVWHRRPTEATSTTGDFRRWPGTRTRHAGPRPVARRRGHRRADGIARRTGAERPVEADDHPVGGGRPGDRDRRRPGDQRECPRPSSEAPRQARPSRAVPRTDRPEGAGRGVPRSSKSRATQDLPPWLEGPMSSKHRMARRQRGCRLDLPPETGQAPILTGAPADVGIPGLFFLPLPLGEGRGLTTGSGIGLFPLHTTCHAPHPRPPLQRERGRQTRIDALICWRPRHSLPILAAVVRPRLLW